MDDITRVDETRLRTVTHPLVEAVRQHMPLTSMNMALPKQRVQAYNAAAEADYDIEEVLGSEIEVTNYVVYVGQYSDPGSGLIKDILRITLIGPDGTRYGSASEGIIQAVSRIIQLVRPAPWSPPLRVIPCEGKSKSGRRYHTLRLAEIEGE